MEREPLYNSRLSKMYILYLSRFYPQLKIEDILETAGITRYQIEDPAHWFTQEQVDRLQNVLVEKTGEPDLSRKVGGLVASYEGMGSGRQYMLGLMTPSIVYQLMAKHYPVLSRAATITTRQIGPNTVEIVSAPKPGVAEKPYQCANRTGIFESLAQLFTLEPARVEHPECFHRGQACCRYTVTWEEELPHRWRRLSRAALFTGTALAIISFTFLPFAVWAGGSLAAGALIGFCAFQAERVAKNSLAKTVESQRRAAEESLAESEVRYNNALLIQEVGQAISAILDVDRLAGAVLGIIEKRLDFDRGMIMLANAEQGVLEFLAGFGQTSEQQDLLEEVRFDLSKPESRGIFVVAMRELRPCLVKDIQDIEESLSPRSRELAHRLDSRSMICVPIVYEKSALGVLVVDKSRSSRPLQQSEVNLLMGIASQLATSIVSARSFENLRQSEKKYRELVETANSLILRVNAEGRISFVNEFAQRLLGAGEAELLNAGAARFLLPPEHSDRWRLEELMASMSGDPLHPEVRETEIPLRSGGSAWIAWTFRPIHDDSGRFREMLCIGNDITELKRAEQERSDLQVQLQRAQKMEAIGTLAGGVAHDLNNILSGIVSYPELLLMDLDAASPLRKPIQTIKKSGEKAAAIVQDLLTLARRGVESVEVVNLNQTVTEYLASPEFAKLQLHHPDVTVETRLEENLLNVLGSPLHLSKALMNLVTNAAEAMPDGGTISIRTGQRHLEAQRIGGDGPATGDYVTLAVTDTGIGIPAEDVERIFEPFYTKKSMGRSGTGLGMAVVWGTVKDHRGHIEIESTEGRGTVISISFPATRRQPKRQPEHVSFDAIAGKGETVLVVDDIREQREIATEILEKLGYRATAVASGEQALVALDRQGVDLVVLDMIMAPGIDGLETFKRILSLRPGQKTIIASGYSESIQVREAQRLGAGAYVRKPYLLHTFGQAVRMELDKPAVSAPNRPAW